MFERYQASKIPWGISKFERKISRELLYTKKMEMAIKTFFKILKYGQTHLNFFFDYFQDVKYSVIQSLKVGNKFKISFHPMMK